MAQIIGPRTHEPLQNMTGENMLFQNVSVWCTDYFNLVTFTISDTAVNNIYTYIKIFISKRIYSRIKLFVEVFHLRNIYLHNKTTFSHIYFLLGLQQFDSITFQKPGALFIPLTKDIL